MRRVVASRAKVLLAAIAFLVFAGCVALKVREVLSPPSDDLIFSHDRHTRLDIECLDCHEASKSVLASDDLIPREASCMKCHDRTQGCELCHKETGKITVRRPRDFGLRFNHTHHLKPDVNPNGCATCHPELAKATVVGSMHPITVKHCLDCHASDMSTGEACGQCHARFGSGRFLPVSHNTTWMQSHGKTAAKSGVLCDVCHRGTIRADFSQGPSIPAYSVLANHAENGEVRDCAGCHRADVWSENVHEHDYLQSHGFDAVRGTTTCESCHRREECRACHERTSLTFGDIHPPGFILDHGVEARRELGACAACHEEDRCRSCHQVVNPHPDGWEPEMTDANRALCVKCHPGGVGG
jgi:hypothetical protein